MLVSDPPMPTSITKGVAFGVLEVGCERHLATDGVDCRLGVRDAGRQRDHREHTTEAVATTRTRRSDTTIAPCLGFRGAVVSLRSARITLQQAVDRADQAQPAGESLRPAEAIARATADLLAVDLEVDCQAKRRRRHDPASIDPERSPRIVATPKPTPQTFGAG